MKKQFIYTSLVYLISLIAACLVNLAVCALSVRIVNLFIVVDYFTAAIIKAVMSLITVAGVVGAVSYYEAYRRLEFRPAYISASIATAGIVHLALSTVMMFHPFIAGGTRYLAGLMDMGIAFKSSDSIKDIYLWTYLASFAIYLIAEIGVSLLCAYIGKAKRISNRKDIEGYPQQDT